MISTDELPNVLIFIDIVYGRPLILMNICIILFSVNPGALHKSFKKILTCCKFVPFGFKGHSQTTLKGFLDF